MVNVRDGSSRGNITITSPSNGSKVNASNNLAEYWSKKAQEYANSALQSATTAQTSSSTATTKANNAHIWAEGTDEEVQALGGEHSSKGWVDYVMEHAPRASVSKAGRISTLTVTDIQGTTTTEINDGVSVTGVTLLSTSGRDKTYRMSFSDSTYFDYVVTDGDTCEAFTTSEVETIWESVA